MLFPDEKEAATVKEIFNLFLNGFSTAEIANHLNTNHPKPDVIWRSASVRFILRNEKYIGDSLFQKNYTPDTLPLKSCCNTGQLPKYYVEGTHPGIISKDEFERVQSLLTQKNINSTNSRACILSKVVFCALCGHVCSRKVRKSQTFVWCCRTHLQSAALCPLKPVSETEIQQAFLSVYNKLQANQSLGFCKNKQILRGKQRVMMYSALQNSGTTLHESTHWDTSTTPSFLNVV